MKILANAAVVLETDRNLVLSQIECMDCGRVEYVSWGEKFECIPCNENNTSRFSLPGQVHHGGSRVFRQIATLKRLRGTVRFKRMTYGDGLEYVSFTSHFTGYNDPGKAWNAYEMGPSKAIYRRFSSCPLRNARRLRYLRRK